MNSGVGWKVVHEALQGIAKRRARLDLEEALLMGHHHTPFVPHGGPKALRYATRPWGAMPRGLSQGSRRGFTRLLGMGRLSSTCALAMGMESGMLVSVFG